MVELSGGERMDVIENVVRSLIKEGKLSRARALLSVFYDEYPQLVFELEEAAGNFGEALKAYDKMPEELKKIYESRAQRLKERLKKDYKSDFRDAVAEMEKKNYEGAFALLEGITKEYPELVEAIALKLEIARKRGDRARAQSLQELLEALDSTHPTLIARRTSKRRTSSFGTFEYTVIVLAAVILAVSLLALFNVPSKAFMEAKFASLSRPQIVKQQVDLKPVEQKIEESYSKIEESLKEIKPQQMGIEDIENVVKKVVDERISGLEEKIGSASQTDVDIKTLVDKVTGLEKKVSELKTTSFDTKPLVDEISSLKDEVNELKKRMNGYFAPPILPGEKVYKPSTQLDAAKIYWLAGYIMYLRNEFGPAIELFKKSLKIINEKFPHVYFQDDCYYYMALSYYMMGDYKTAKNLFESFIKDFPKSEYVDDAERFLKRIRG